MAAETTPPLSDAQKPWGVHDQATQEADSEIPGWQPNEKAAQLPQKRETLETARVASVQKKEGPKDPSVQRRGYPRTLASRRHWLLQVVAATAGVSLYSIVIWLILVSLFFVGFLWKDGRRKKIDLPIFVYVLSLWCRLTQTVFMISKKFYGPPVREGRRSGSS